ncbi:MAG: hypothetical protein ACETVR_02550 [Candidatus Bathyarchaeia archaeon]
MSLVPVREEPYYAVLWTRWRIRDLEELEKMFGVDFLVTRPNWVVPERLYDWILGGHFTRYELWVKADSLHALLYSIRAVLYQKEAQPFTSRDHRLFELISMVYAAKRMLPFFPKVEKGVKWRQNL